MDYKARERKEKAHSFGQFATGKIFDIDCEVINGGKPFSLSKLPDNYVITIGKRVCSIKLNCGLDNRRLLKALSREAVPHLVPWECEGPIAYQDGRYVVIQAPFPRGLQVDNIPLSTVADSALDDSRVVLGPNDWGSVITLDTESTEHILIGGATGSGKSWLLRSIGYQLSGDLNWLVLIDGKQGEGLRICDGLPGQVGPLATQPSEIIDALGWVVEEKERRYGIKAQAGGHLNALDDLPPIFVLYDEFHVLCQGNTSPAVVKLLHLIATQGRAAKIHLIAATQKPLVNMFGDNGVGSVTRDQFTASIGGFVRTREASAAILGINQPSCTMLLPKGDNLVNAMAATGNRIERVQAAYVPEAMLQQAAGGVTRLQHWPAFDTEGLEAQGKRGGRPRDNLTPRQVAIAIEAAKLDKRRDWYRKQFDGKRPGAQKADRALEYGAETLSEMTARGVKVEVADGAK